MTLHKTFRTVTALIGVLSTTGGARTMSMSKETVGYDLA
jgi:hypothetical protein